MRLAVPPPAVALVAAVIVWALDRSFPAISLSFAWQGFVAALIALTGVALDLVSVFGFLKAKTTVLPTRPERSSKLVTTGTYQISRNPMYLGMLMILTGWVVWRGNPLGVLALAGFVLWITKYQIKPEEEILNRLFGHEFEQYCASVRRWI